MAASERGFGTGLILGVGLTLPLGLLVALVGYSAVSMKETAVRRGWNLVPVVVASRTLAPGDTLTQQEIAHREVPEQMVTSSTTEARFGATLIGRRVLVPVEQGQVIQPNFLEAPEAKEGPQAAARRACPPAGSHAATPRTLETVSAVREALAQERP